MHDSEYDSLIRDIARRELTAKQLARLYGIGVADLRLFVEENLEAIQTERDRLDGKIEEDEPELWIASKSERLKRYQAIADKLLSTKHHDATSLRELRSYMRYAADELGQLLHRGAGGTTDESTVNYSIEGINLEELR